MLELRRRKEKVLRSEVLQDLRIGADCALFLHFLL